MEWVSDQTARNSTRWCPPLPADGGARVTEGSRTVHEAVMPIAQSRVTARETAKRDDRDARGRSPQGDAGIGRMPREEC